MKRRQVMAGAAVVAFALVVTLLLSAGRGEESIASYSHRQRHDAGRLVVTLPHAVTHRFHFRNHREEAIDLTGIRPACGCTKVEAPVRHFEPGAVGWIDMTSTLFAPGAFSTSLALDWSTGEHTTYEFYSFAQVSREFTLSRVTVDLEVDQPRTIVLSYVDQSGQAPGPVTFEQPEGIEVEVAPWKQIVAADKRHGIAARYAASARLRLSRSIAEIGRVDFSLSNYPEVPQARLVVRTPELIDRHGREVLERLRQGAGPIAPGKAGPGESAVSTRP